MSEQVSVEGKKGDEQCDDMMFEVRYILYYTVLHCTVPYCVLLAPTSPPSSS